MRKIAHLETCGDAVAGSIMPVAVVGRLPGFTLPAFSGLCPSKFL